MRTGFHSWQIFLVSCRYENLLFTWTNFTFLNPIQWKTHKAMTIQKSLSSTLLMWKPSSSTEDYHSQVNLENYERLQKKLIPNSLLNSVIVINTVPFCNVPLENTPSSHLRRLDMINWISSHDVLYSDEMFKSQLHKTHS